ncbi:GWxTD domain-containing protein [Algoriphagus sediminis]|uniref:GWxTD domain-containing protein n=1 Tax=Algoriphagus sediminis TaxID=3057113 RepID=A0ABT7Y9V7_9BACT|nr:GWxTD domain-containing protein [Algoriphagus sediminis]MDN3203290.1 GWxTD domain-containing protein [Algoriphagus sediminis]
MAKVSEISESQLDHMNPGKLLLTALFCFFFLFGFTAKAQRTLETLDQSLRYSRYSRLGLKIIPIQTRTNSFKLLMQVEKIEQNPSFDAFNFSYTLLDSYDQEITEDKIILLSENDLSMDTERHWVFEKEVILPEDVDTQIALLSVLDTRQGDEYLYHIDLKGSYVYDQPRLGAFYANGVAFDQTYINQSQSLLFDSFDGPSIHSFFYPIDFSIPYPPMETRPANVPKELEVIDKGDFVENIPRSLDEEGYYFFQTDTSELGGLMIKTTHEAFPKVKDWEEMVDIVTYISTRKEHEELLEAEDKKKALDEYWIGMTRNPDTAKEVIREYFRQIEFANILFTDFKEGWKTDRGMVYIVMGPPNEVNFFEDREVWTYGGDSQASKIKFTFARIKNVLTPHYYTLNRSRAYQPIWFKNISEWRNGRMAF